MRGSTVTLSKHLHQLGHFASVEEPQSDHVV